MAKWRPEGWGNPYIGKFNTPQAMVLQRDAYEAGADAMLKAVVSWITKGDGDSIPFFIPDVEEEKK